MTIEKKFTKHIRRLNNPKTTLKQIRKARDFLEKHELVDPSFNLFDNANGRGLSNKGDTLYMLCIILPSMEKIEAQLTKKGIKAVCIGSIVELKDTKNEPPVIEWHNGNYYIKSENESSKGFISIKKLVKAVRKLYSN